MSDRGNLNDGHTGDEYVRLTVRVSMRVKHEAPDDASEQVGGLGGPAQAPPSHEQVNAWLAQGWPFHGAQPCGFGGPAQAPPVQVGVKQEPVQAPAAEEQPAVHVPVHNEQALAAAVQAPAPGGPVRRNRVPAVRRNPMRRVRFGPRPEREKKPPQFLADYVRPDNKGGYEAY